MMSQCVKLCSSGFNSFCVVMLRHCDKFSSSSYDGCSIESMSVTDFEHL